MNLLHVGLQVIKEDVENFYVNVLGGRLQNSFKLKGHTSEKLFDIPSETEVVNVKMDELLFELFVHETIAPKSYAHFCIKVAHVKAIINTAKKLHYKTVLHKNSTGKATWFLYDNNNNIFELK